MLRFLRVHFKQNPKLISEPVLKKGALAGGILLLVSQFAIAAAPTAKNATAATAASTTKVTLALNWKAEPQFGGFYAAQLNGEFKKRNLEVKILEGGSGTPTVQMISSKTVDFGIVSAEEILISREHGSDVTGLFAVYQTNPQAIMIHKNTKIKNLADLFNSNGVLAWQSGLSYAHYLQKKYPHSNLKKVPYTGGISAFLKHPEYSQQCFFTSEPLLAEKAGESIQTFLVSEEGFNPYTTVLAASSAKLAENPAISKAMVESVRAGWSAYLKDPGPTNKLMSTLNKAMDLETFKKSADLQKPLIQAKGAGENDLGTMTEERWNQLTTQLQDLKLIKKGSSSEKPFRNL